MPSLLAFTAFAAFALSFRAFAFTLSFGAVALVISFRFVRLLRRSLGTGAGCSSSGRPAMCRYASGLLAVVSCSRLCPGTLSISALLLAASFATGFATTAWVECSNIHIVSTTASAGRCAVGDIHLAAMPDLHEVRDFFQ